MVKHFQEKEALAHVLEKRAEGALTLSEMHGKEMPGYMAAALDALRETTIAILLFWLFLWQLKISSVMAFFSFVAFGVGWLIWKTARSGWLGWARLERLHRLIEQEKYEIEHHRPQEREELLALYQAKGFEGATLYSVVDVLMADQDRLLKVMLEEEMGLTLQVYEHPLQQTVGAGIGTLIALTLSGLCFFFFPLWGIPAAACFLIFSSSWFSAYKEKNRMISALVWNLSFGILSFGASYFLFTFLTSL
jgi:vacuolar iron transporter family protein